MMTEVRIYQELGLSFFPLPHGKKESTIAWKQYQERKPTNQEIENWFSNETKQNIAIVCGRVSGNLVILDADSEERFGELAFIIEEKTGASGIFNYTLVSTTGRGYHIWLFVEELPPSAKFPALDIKSEGGYIVAPPSLHPSGKEYKFLNPGKPIQRIKSLLDIGIDLNQRKTETLSGNEPDNWVSRAMQGVGEGERDSTCAKLAGYYLNKLPPDITKTILYGYADKCKPPFPHQDVDKVINSIARKHPQTPNDGIDSLVIVPLANGTDSKRDKSVTKSVTKGDIEGFLRDSHGWFSYDDLDRELGIKTDVDKASRRQIFKRLRDESVIESHPQNNKLYRYVNVDFRVIDFKKAGGREPLDIKFPFGIERYYNCYPGNIIVVAGVQDAGKTAFLLNFVKLNQFDYSIFYQSSEMGETELASRLQNFDDIGLDDWNFKAEERSSNFADVIRPGCINIIDYLEISDSFYMVAEYLKQIHEKLADGIAIVAIQKDPKSEQGRGGTFSLEKPRLYLNIDPNVISIRKCKNWVNHSVNPKGLKLNFKTVKGCNFITTRDWYKDDDL